MGYVIPIRTDQDLTVTLPGNGDIMSIDIKNRKINVNVYDSDNVFNRVTIDKSLLHQMIGMLMADGFSAEYNEKKNDPKIQVRRRGILEDDGWTPWETMNPKDDVLVDVRDDSFIQIRDYVPSDTTVGEIKYYDGSDME